MRPIITLTTDFGMADGWVGAMIGVIKSICPDADVINLASEIPPQDVVHGAWALMQAAPFFPPDAIHIAVVDPGVGTKRRGILAIAERGRFIGPDNGILSWALRSAGDLTVRALENPQYRLAPVGFTFDGRDLFAPAAAHLAVGIDPAEFGPIVADPFMLDWPEPRRSPGRIEGEIIVVDRFGNLVSNVSFAAVAEEFGDTALAISIGGRSVGGIVPGYAAIRDELGVVINGAGLLEIAAKSDSAERLTGLGRGVKILITAA